MIAEKDGASNSLQMLHQISQTAAIISKTVPVSKCLWRRAFGLRARNDSHLHCVPSGTTLKMRFNTPVEFHRFEEI